MNVKPRLRHTPNTSWEWYAYIDVKVEGIAKVQRLHGLGWTAEGAMIGLRENLILRNRMLERYGKQIVLNLPLPRKVAPTHCLATSNLSWWKRLFRL